MSVYFTSDPHLGHENIARFRSYVKDADDNTRIFLEDYESVVHKKDIVYFLGDVAFNDESLEHLRGLKGRKILIKGNHDDLVSTQKHAEVFEEIHGMLKYKGFWLTHCPIHPLEMRGRRGNIHGHVHSKTIPDDAYLNVCCDNLKSLIGHSLISLDHVREIFKAREPAGPLMK